MTLRSLTKLKIRAYGTPRPQGSMTPMMRKGGGRIYLKSPSTTAEWRAIVTAAALEAISKKRWRSHDGPISLDLVFIFQRPKAMPKWRRAHTEKDNGSDLDKLCRAVGDSLDDAGVYDDDRRIQSLRAVKVYGNKPGAKIKVTAHEINR